MSIASLYFFHLQSRGFNQMHLFVRMVARLAAIKRRDQIHEVYKAVRHVSKMLVKLWSEDVSQDQRPQRKSASSRRT